MATKQKKRRPGRGRPPKQVAKFVRHSASALMPDRLDPSEGQHHDLAVILEEVRRDYFDGRYREAKIHWGRHISSGRPRDHKSLRYGHCVIEDGAIKIHRALDRAFVPLEFVKFIVFHELLHLKHKPQMSRGRMVFHPPVFIYEEESFAYYDKMVRWERRNINRLFRF